MGAIAGALAHIENESAPQFLNNIEKWGCKGTDGDFDIVKYSSK